MDKLKSFSEHKHKMEEQRKYTDDDVRQLINNYNQNKNIEDRVEVIFELLLSLISKSYSKSIHETRITSKQLSVSAMGRYIRKLSEKIKRESDIDKKLNLIAEIVLFSTQLLDIENESIYSKVND